MSGQQITSAPSPSARLNRPGLPWWQAAPLGVASVVVVNLLLLGAGSLAGASMAHPDPADPAAGNVAVTIADVVLASAVPLAVGLAVTLVLSLLWTGFLRTGQIIGAAAAALSALAPLLSLDTDVPTRIVLALMHLALAPAVWLSLAAVRTRVSR